MKKKLREVLKVSRLTKVQQFDENFEYLPYIILIFQMFASGRCVNIALCLLSIVMATCVSKRIHIEILSSFLVIFYGNKLSYFTIVFLALHGIIIAWEQNIRNITYHAFKRYKYILWCWDLSNILTLDHKCQMIIIFHHCCKIVWNHHQFGNVITTWLQNSSRVKTTKPPCVGVFGFREVL